MNFLAKAICIAPLAMIASHAGAQAVQPPSAQSNSLQSQSEDQPRSLASDQKRSRADEPLSVLSAKELAEMRGGAQTAVNQQNFISDNSGGTIGGDFNAGDVSISDNALSNFNGLGNIVINTGAQSSLQAGLGVTINVSD